MPVTIFVADDDTTCPVAKAETLIDKLPNLKNFIRVPSATHEYFFNESTATFTEQLQRELVAQELAATLVASAATLAAVLAF